MYCNGANAERELKEMLEMQGFYVIRSAGSLATDLIAIRNSVCFAIEVKSINRNKFYLTDKTRLQLSILHNLKQHGLIPILAIKFKRRGWNFLKVREKVSSIVSYDYQKASPLIDKKTL